MEVKAVACQWRIRHKLILGLGLVACIMALLLGGTLLGLRAYTYTIKSIGSKVEELNRAEDLRNAISKLKERDDTNADEDNSFSPNRQKFQKRVRDARDALGLYEQQLRGTLARGRDPGMGYTELGLVEELREAFDKLDKGLKKVWEPKSDSNGTGIFLDRFEVSQPLHQLDKDADELREQLHDSIRTLIRNAQAPYYHSLEIVLSTSVFGVLLMAGLLLFFYRWVFYPVRDLQEGANRIARGDFDHRIKVHSGDEMEDLACAFNDMTDRLAEMYRDLAHQVNERSRQLVRSERLASVGFLAAGVAHEINNPLASIAFCGESLEGRLDDVLEAAGAANPRPALEEGPVIRKYLKMIQEEAFRCKGITERLLEFSRGSERRREYTDLAELIQSVLEMVQHLQNYKDRQIVFEPDRPIHAWINAQEIKSVVLNLVVNALDSMDDHGTLTITLSTRDRMAEMVFADTGCGMPPEILENIFEPFFTRSRTGKGTGLGLSISHRVVSQHRGEIEAASSGLNQGSTFTVRLPMQPAEAAKEETFGHAAA
jgi:signal transduction histidine kinase